MDRLNIFAGAANRLIFASASYIIKVRIKVCFEKNFRNKLLDKLEFDEGVWFYEKQKTLVGFIDYWNNSLRRSIHRFCV
jgi:hypothetical protein